MKPSLRRQAFLRFSSVSSSFTSSTTVPAPFVCTSCLLTRPSISAQASTISYPSRTAPSRTYATENQNPDLTERLRRRIWKTDTPPGQIDPYKHLTPEEKAAEEAARASQTTNEKDVEDAEDSEYPDYIPATTWDGLKSIGGKRHAAKAEARSLVWDGAFSEGQIPGVEGWERDVPGFVRRVAVELLALQRNGVPLAKGAKAVWVDEDLVEEIDIVRSEGGEGEVWELREGIPDGIDELVEELQAKVEVVQEAVEEEITEDMIDEDVEFSEEEFKILADEEEAGKLHAEEDAAAEAIEAEEQENGLMETVASTKVHDPVFLEMPVTDLAFKFALVKRLTYLLGKRIPDPKIAQFRTLKDVVDHLSEKSVPKKLAQILLEMPELKNLPNVQISDRRRSWISKEMEIGRWKVIKADLEARGLPVPLKEKKTL